MERETILPISIFPELDALRKPISDREFLEKLIAAPEFTKKASELPPPKESPPPKEAPRKKKSRRTKPESTYTPIKKPIPLSAKEVSKLLALDTSYAHLTVSKHPQVVDHVLVAIALKSEGKNRISVAIASDFIYDCLKCDAYIEAPNCHYYDPKGLSIAISRTITKSPFVERDNGDWIITETGSTRLRELASDANFHRALAAYYDLPPTKDANEVGRLRRSLDEFNELIQLYSEEVHNYREVIEEIDRKISELQQQRRDIEKRMQVADQGYQEAINEKGIIESQLGK